MVPQAILGAFQNGHAAPIPVKDDQYFQVLIL